MINNSIPSPSTIRQNRPASNQERPAGKLRCPYLGLAADPGTSLTEPSPEHRCYANGHPRKVILGHQADLCLAPKFESCPRYIHEAKSSSNAHRRTRDPRLIWIIPVLLALLAVLVWISVMLILSHSGQANPGFVPRVGQAYSGPVALTKLHRAAQVDFEVRALLPASLYSAAIPTVQLGKQLS